MKTNYNEKNNFCFQFCEFCGLYVIKSEHFLIKEKKIQLVYFTSLKFRNLTLALNHRCMAAFLSPSLHIHAIKSLIKVQQPASFSDCTSCTGGLASASPCIIQSDENTQQD